MHVSACMLPFMQFPAYYWPEQANNENAWLFLPSPHHAMSESTPSDYVKLISSDGFEFIIHREAAMRSGTIKNMLVGPGKFYHPSRVRMQPTLNRTKNSAVQRVD